MSLAMLVIGFAIFSTGSPEAGVPLHEARASGNDDFASVLEKDLKAKQRTRTVLLVGLFAGSGGMVCAGFSAMKNHN